MEFVYSVELFIIIFSAICWLFYSPVEPKVVEQMIDTSEFEEVNDIEMALSSIILQLEQIQNSGLIQRIVALPEGHPELETIMGDALHYTMELQMRINQSSSRGIRG